MLASHLFMKKLQNKKRSLTTCEEALKDILPIQWEDDVLSGTKKVLLIGKGKRTIFPEALRNNSY